MNAAILLAGGIGSRLHNEIPKQYLEVCGRPIFAYALETLFHCEKIDTVQIVAADCWRNLIKDNAKKLSYSDKLIGFSQPGRNRQESIFHGLQDLFAKEEKPKLVLVHDAVRACVSEEMLDGLFYAMEQDSMADGVIPVLPMKDTVYFSEDGKEINSLLPRENVYAGQAPELFSFASYYMANKKLSTDEMMKINGSTEPAVMDGMKMITIPGDEKNFKITTQNDLDRFTELVKRSKRESLGIA